MCNAMQKFGYFYRLITFESDIPKRMQSIRMNNHICHCRNVRRPKRVKKFECETFVVQSFSCSALASVARTEQPWPNALIFCLDQRIIRLSSSKYRSDDMRNELIKFANSVGCVWVSCIRITSSIDSIDVRSIQGPSYFAQKCRTVQIP